VAVFGGLRAKDILGCEDPAVELDGWISVQGCNPGTSRLLLGLRRELQDALSWQALAALSGIGTPAISYSYLARSAALLRASVSILSGKQPEQSDVEFVKGWKPVEGDRSSSDGAARERSRVQLRKDGSGVQRPAATSSSRQGEHGTRMSGIMAELQGKKLPELKQILREHGLKVTGRRLELVERCAEALAEARGESGGAS